MAKRRTVSKHKCASDCAHCRNLIPFQMPPDLYESFVNSRVVIFAGAGVSTENRESFPFKLVEEIRSSLELAPEESLPFPDLMSAFCEQPDGRRRLLAKIKNRFDYVESFPEVRRNAARFHNELSTLYTVQEIITTNWDTYFESECGAIPFVVAEDFAFSELPGRKVFKLHGSINSYGSIVATREDYENCYQHLSTGLLGSALKVLLASKTLVYVGFSFGDDDFNRIHDTLTSEMKGLRPHSYVVTPDDSQEEFLRKKGLSHIRTDGTFFISEVKKRMVAEHRLVSDERFEGVEILLDQVVRAHRRIACIRALEYPEVIFGLSYQDGLMHCLERILALRKTGRYSEAGAVARTGEHYDAYARAEKLKQKRFHDVAYVDGYADGLAFFLMTDEERRLIPIYYMYNSKRDIRDFRTYFAELKKSNKSRRPEHRWAVQIVARVCATENLEFHHTPFL